MAAATNGKKSTPSSNIPNIIAIRKVVPSLEAMLRVNDTCAITGLTRARVYELEEKGLFPRRYSLEGRVVAWKLSEVQQWIDNRQVVYVEEKRAAGSGA